VESIDIINPSGCVRGVVGGWGVGLSHSLDPSSDITHQHHSSITGTRDTRHPSDINVYGHTSSLIMMESPMKQIGLGPCKCRCHRQSNLLKGTSADASSAENATLSRPQAQTRDSFVSERPTMTEIHRLLQDRQWREVRHAIRLDSSVAMRVDDSEEEDSWFNEARRRKAVHAGVVESVRDSEGAGKVKVDGETNRQSHLDVANNYLQQQPMQLRYWVGNQNDTNSNEQSYVRARVEMQQRRTLLHVICKMNFLSNEALVVQLTHGDSDGMRDLMEAVKTAEMLIDASHNELKPLDDEDYYHEKDEEDTATVEEGGLCSQDCLYCSCFYYHNYCPPVPFPTIERSEAHLASVIELALSEGDIAEVHGDQYANFSSVQHVHESLLTVTDRMLSTPLHTLTGQGSCHPNLVQVIMKSCRPLDDRDARDEWPVIDRPSVHKLLSAQNGHGCTPLHFLAGKFWWLSFILYDFNSWHSYVDLEKAAPTSRLFACCFNIVTESSIPQAILVNCSLLQ
jgi:hypothetical protein